MAPSPAPRFDAFLAASVGEERHGQLSVLSLLSRLGLDPWVESSALAALPSDAAKRRLASLIRSLPAEGADPDVVAARLIAQLPRRSLLPDYPVATTAATVRSTASPWLILLAASLAILTAIAYWSDRAAPPTDAPPVTRPPVSE